MNGAITTEQFNIFSNKMRFMNFFMTLTIAAMHISYNCGGEDWFTINVLRRGAGGAMGWFFFMSAFWYFKDYNHNVFMERFVKRLKTLLVPYIVWNTIKFMLVYGKAILKAGTFRGYEMKFLNCLMFTRFNGLEYMPIVGPLWYIIRLLSYFLIAPVIYFAIKNKNAGLFTMIALFLFTRRGEYYYFDGWLCLFVIGAYVGLHYRNAYVRIFTKINFLSKNKWVGFLGMLCSYCILIAIWTLMTKAGIAIVPGISYIIGYFLAAVPICLFDVPNIPKSFSGYSFGIYCGHVVLYEVINRCFGKVNSIISVGGTPWAIFLLTTICVVIICGSKLLHKMSPRLEALFTGGR